MDKIWDRKSFEVGGHWPMWWVTLAVVSCKVVNPTEQNHTHCKQTNRS